MARDTDDPTDATSTRTIEEFKNLDRGHQVILDGHAGRFTLFTPIQPAGSVIGWEVLDEDLNRHKIRNIKAGGEEFLHFIPEGEEKGIYALDDEMKTKDFDVVDKSLRPIEKYADQMWR